jgi:cyclopropane fatty-acyl-phospholipid synthase-like methyltransferase
MGTAEANARLWGHRAEEWAELQEQTALPLYNHVFDALKVSSETRYLDDGCGSGLALSEAARRGAVRALNSSGVAARAMRNTSGDEVAKAHETALAEFLKPDGTVSVPNRFRYLVAIVS